VFNRPARAALAIGLLAALASACQPTAVVPAPVPVAASAASASAPAPVTQKAQLLAAINDARAQAGVGPLRLHDGVAEVARQWAAQLAREGALRHRPGLHDALLARGIRPTYWAENVGMGSHALQVHEAFMRSAPHRANALDARFTQVGIGTVAADGRVWVVVDLIG
jgi:uncharacterized protein YkwD